MKPPEFPNKLPERNPLDDLELAKLYYTADGETVFKGARRSHSHFSFVPPDIAHDIPDFHVTTQIPGIGPEEAKIRGLGQSDAFDHGFSLHDPIEIPPLEERLPSFLRDLPPSDLVLPEISGLERKLFPDPFAPVKPSLDDLFSKPLFPTIQDEFLLKPQFDLPDISSQRFDPLSLPTQKPFEPEPIFPDNQLFPPRPAGLDFRLPPLPEPLKPDPFLFKPPPGLPDSLSPTFNPIFEPFKPTPLLPDLPDTHVFYNPLDQIDMSPKGFEPLMPPLPEPYKPDLFQRDPPLYQSPDILSPHLAPIDPILPKLDNDLLFEKPWVPPGMDFPILEPYKPEPLLPMLEPYKEPMEPLIPPMETWKPNVDLEYFSPSIQSPIEFIPPESPLIEPPPMIDFGYTPNVFIQPDPSPYMDPDPIQHDIYTFQPSTFDLPTIEPPLIEPPPMEIVPPPMDFGFSAPPAPFEIEGPGISSPPPGQWVPDSQQEFLNNFGLDNFNNNIGNPDFLPPQILGGGLPGTGPGFEDFDDPFDMPDINLLP